MRLLFMNPRRDGLMGKKGGAEIYKLIECEKESPIQIPA